MRRPRPDPRTDPRPARRPGRDSTPPSGGLAARRGAIQLLLAVLRDRRLMSEALALLPATLAPAERARAQRLATQTLRGLGTADRLLKPHLARPPAPEVRAILRLGVTELGHGAAAHGVVNDLVEIAARGRRSAGAKGLVNAVLRKLAPEALALWTEQPPPRLPRWLRQPLVAAWGVAAVAAMERVHAGMPPLDLTARADPAGLAASLGGRLLPTGSVRLVEAPQVSALPGFAEGGFWVQDAAAALPVRLLDPRPGERVLDLCAAPGGKTLQLAAAGARVTALDLPGPRLARLRDNLARTGLAAELVEADALAWQGGPFDAVLLDAPCSATGTIRRHPELPLVRDGSGLADLARQQAALIDRALECLAPGGRLVFCTCSLLPEEGEAQVEAALARHPSLRVRPAAGDWIDPRWRSAEGGLRVLPHHWQDEGGIDGFYLVAFDRGDA